jgi:hypothetical protein
MANKPILCLDFDGVLHSYKSGWQGAENIPDPPVPGAINFLCNAIDHFEVNIFSSRSHQPGGIYAMRCWLKTWSVKTLGETNGLCRRLCDEIQFPDHKPAAAVSIDDRCLTFTGRWPSINNLKEFKPWNYGNGSSKSLDASLTVDGRVITDENPLIVNTDLAADTRRIIDQFAAAEERKLWNDIRYFLSHAGRAGYFDAAYACTLIDRINHWCPPTVDELPSQPLLPSNRHNGYPRS